MAPPSGFAEEAAEHAAQIAERAVAFAAEQAADVGEGAFAAEVGEDLVQDIGDRPVESAAPATVSPGSACAALNAAIAWATCSGRGRSFRRGW
ncbi:hypothetical protein [Sphingomonas melonis]|uniref:hypothetical protein n=1 Tax=Sphingomonas melonis TaxID=152682 RepID=UPI000874F885|nr:hypothetical protein [Sphingomonas melonis]